MTLRVHFSSITDFLRVNSKAGSNKDIQFEYDAFLRIKATSEQDHQAKIQSALSAREKYKLLSSSCNTMVLNAISRAKGVDFSSFEKIPKMTFMDLFFVHDFLDNQENVPNPINGSFEVGPIDYTGWYDDNEGFHPVEN